MTRDRQITGILFGILFLTSVDNQLLIPLVPLLGREFNVTVTTLGWLFSAYALCAALFNLVLGPLTDRYGRVWFFGIGLFIFLAMAGLTTRSTGFTDLLWLRAGTGLAAGLLSTATAGFVGDYFPYERRGRVMGIVLSSYFAALIVGIPVGSWLAEARGWRTVFLVSFTIALVLLLLVLWRIPKDSGSETTSFAQVWRAYALILKTVETRAALATSFCVSGGTLAFLTFISGYLNETFGLDTIAISTVFLVSGLGAAVASPISGWLSDKWTKKRVFLIANSSLAVPLLVLSWFEVGIFLFGCLFLISLAISFRQTSLQTLQTELIPFERRGAFLALRNCSSQLGISASVFCAGLLYSNFGYAAVTVLAAGLTLAGSFLLQRMVSEPNDSSPTE
jgi:predicted MFS family arabinose efflux permease